MMKGSSSEQHDRELETLRSLILGQDDERVIKRVKGEARTLVSDIVTEALHDRENKDGSVKHVIQPLVEDAVEQSVATNREKLISSLYPIVGSLVRKSVSAFLNEFMEKTNQLLENSLTIRGITWRIKAWRSGVSFAQYIAAQTFVYRVEHVFLIHKETGLLLKSVTLDTNSTNDAELISSMLTAINDFVGDSFLTQKDSLREELQNVSTDNFTLMIKPGPNAIVVAAVTGNPPSYVNEQLQITLENIQKLYFSELTQFNGDNQAFDQTDNLLRECLLSESKKDQQQTKKKPWLARILVLLVVVFLGYLINLTLQENHLHNKLMTLDNEAGIVVRNIEVNHLNQATLDILRDPLAIPVMDWLEEQQITIKNINVMEKRYHALDADILHRRAQKILTQFPTIDAQWQNNILTLSGTLSATSLKQLLSLLVQAGFIKQTNLITDAITLAPLAITINNHELQKQLFNKTVGEIAAIQLDFAVKSAEVTPNMQSALMRLTQLVQKAETIAKQLNIPFALIIIGSSDNSGQKSTNEALSVKRAEQASLALQQLGIDKKIIYTTGIGQVEVTGVENTARKVLFNVLYINN